MDKNTSSVEALYSEDNRNVTLSIEAGDKILTNTFDVIGLKNSFPTSVLHSFLFNPETEEEIKLPKEQMDRLYKDIDNVIDSDELMENFKKCRYQDQFEHRVSSLIKTAIEHNVSIDTIMESVSRNTLEFQKNIVPELETTQLKMPTKAEMQMDMM